MCYVNPKRIKNLIVYEFCCNVSRVVVSERKIVTMALLSFYNETCRLCCMWNNGGCNMISLFEGNDGRTLAARITRLTGIKVMEFICTCLLLFPVISCWVKVKSVLLHHMIKEDNIQVSKCPHILWSSLSAP